MASVLKLPVLLLVQLISILLFWNSRYDEIGPGFIFTVTLNAFLISLVIGFVLFLFSLTIEIGSFVSTGVAMVLVSVIAYISTFFYTGVLASPTASPKTIAQASLVMQACMYCILTVLMVVWILNEKD
jgi:hypothetical protein